MDQSRDISSAQIKAARALLGLSQDDLASEAGIARKTLYEMENGSVVRVSNLSAVRGVLEARGLLFVVHEGRAGVLGPRGNLRT
ncbi:helix-turn-helix domain-containing protein [Devosia sp. UYZn731]|uniref:helix-turn-helix transcriptional regulator n=1 Tax=Devosia sp. UYZn731 TaxID=3156345 RepID=UPI003393D45E